MQRWLRLQFQANQNDQHGGQSIPNFDYGLAQGVAKSFAKLYTSRLTESLEDVLESSNESDVVKEVIQKVTEDTGSMPCLERNEVEYDRAVAEELIGRCGLEPQKAKRIVAMTRKRAVKQTENETYPRQWKDLYII